MQFKHGEGAHTQWELGTLEGRYSLCNIAQLIHRNLRYTGLEQYSLKTQLIQSEETIGVPKIQPRNSAKQEHS